MIKNIRHTCIVVRNLKKALYFYCNILGMKIVKRERLLNQDIDILLGENDIDLTYVKLKPKKGNTLLELYYFNKRKMKLSLYHHSFNHIAFTVENIDKLFKRLNKENISIASGPMRNRNYRLFFCRDFEGNLVEFCEEL